MQKTGRRVPVVKERRLSTCLYPLPDGFYVGLQQWLWCFYKDEPAMRLLATTPLVDPRPAMGRGCGRTECEYHGDGKGGWDHPDYVYATFIPNAFAYFARTWCMQKYAGQAREHLMFMAQRARIVFEGHELSVWDMAGPFEDGGRQYDWFASLHDPWRKGADWFDKTLPAATSKQQRFEILHRDGFRCQLCGRAAHDGVRLEVDHIMPQSKGGKAVPWNLWTLCADCNGAKSNKYWSGGAS